MRKIAIVVPSSASGVSGGAELLYKGLQNAFLKRGYDAKLVQIIVDESSFESILKAYESFKNLDLSSYDGVISTKAPSYNIVHKNHICYLLHTIRVFYDRFDDEMKNTSDNRFFRDEIIKLDTDAFNKIDNLLTIGHEVTNRLMKYNNIYHSEVLHPPLIEDNFKLKEYKNFAFIPSRLHRWKKIDFLINSWKYVKSDIELYIAGEGEDRNYFEKLATKDTRVKFLGKISDDELVSYYSECLFVPFTPIDEDYGYVTLEAFRSKKMVLTCKDSGEPTNMVINNVNGFVLDRDEKEFAARVDWICSNKDKAELYGEQGYKLTQNINWDDTIKEFIKRFDFDKE